MNSLNKEELIRERLYCIFNSAAEDNKYSNSYLVDPHTCEVLNRCGLSSAMLTAYYRHMEYIKATLLIKGNSFKNFMFKLEISGSILEIVLTAVACLVYIVGTYYGDKYQTEFFIADFVLASVFFVDWVVNLQLSQRKWDFVISKMSLIDLLTIVPTYIEFIFLSEGLADLSFLRILRVVRVVRVLRMFKIFRSKEEDNESTVLRPKHSSGISKQIAVMGVALLSVLFIGAGIFHALNFLQEDSIYCTTEFDFLTAFYFIVVTSSTLGYGDIYPLTATARLISVVLIVVLVYVISDQVSRISYLVSNCSKYDKKYSLANHIIVTGYYTHRSLNSFLNEFYHTDHGYQKASCLVVGANYPPPEVVQTIKEARTSAKVYYLEGDPFSKSTMKKANIFMANAVFILTTQNSENLEETDMRSILISKQIQHLVPYTPTYLQLVNPYKSSDSELAPWNTVVSLKKFKMCILGLSLFNKGFTVSVSGLLTSLDLKIPSSMQKTWVLQVTQAIGQEIYCVGISDYLIGKNFSTLVKLIYFEIKGVLVIGTKTTHKKKNKSLVLINPGNYVLAKSDKLFVIANDQATADLIENFVPKYKSFPKPSSFRLEQLRKAFVDSYYEINSSLSENESKNYFEIWKENLNGVFGGHVLVWGTPENFAELIKVVRAYSSKPVCLVCNQHPNYQWEKLKSTYSSIYYFKGSFLNLQELYNSAIVDSYGVLVLPTNDKYAYSSDSNSALVARLVQNYFPKVKLLVDLHDESYIKFLGGCPEGKFKQLPKFMWPKFLSGECFFSSALDSLVCQVFYNPNLTGFLEKLVDLSQKSNLENSKIRSIEVPSTIPDGISYSELFANLLELDSSVIPLALVSNSLDSFEQVVLTNPLPSTQVFPGDCILCIGEPLEIHGPSEASSLESRRSIKTEVRLLESLKLKFESYEKLQIEIQKRNKALKDLQKAVQSLCEEYKEALKHN